MKNYYFISDSGELHDTRRTGWAESTLRSIFSNHHREVDTTQKLLSCLRAGEYSIIGGYQLAFLTEDGLILSFDAVRDELYQCIYAMRHDINDGWHIVALVNLDEMDHDVDCICEHTGKVLYSVGEDS